MSVKITMKIDEDAHKALQIAKALLGAKSFSEAIKQLAEPVVSVRGR